MKSWCGFAFLPILLAILGVLVIVAVSGGAYWWGHVQSQPAQVETSQQEVQTQTPATGSNTGGSASNNLAVRIDSINPSTSAADGSIITVRGAGFNLGLPGSNDTVIFRNPSTYVAYIPETVLSDGATLTFKLTGIAEGSYQVSVGVARAAQDRPGSVTVKSNSLPFTVTSKGITLLSPNGGEVFKAGNSISVQWKSSQSDSFFISLLGDPTQGYCLGPNFTQALAGDESGNMFTISPATTLRLTEGNTCRFKIKVTSNTNASVTDQSDNYFTVTP